MTRKDFITTIEYAGDVSIKGTPANTWLLLAITQLLYAIADNMGAFEDDEEDPE